MPHDFEAVERDLFIPPDVALAPCDVDLLVHAVDASEVWQQQAASPAALDDDAIALDIELRLVRDAFRRRQDIDIVDEVLEFVCRDRRETRILRARRDGVAQDFCCETVLRRQDRADAAAQTAISLE